MTKLIKAVQYTNGEVYEYSDAWDRALAAGDCQPLYGKDADAALKAFRRVKLLEMIKPGDSLKVVCTQASKSGMSARFKVLIPLLSPEGRMYIRDITKDIADFAGFKLNPTYNEIVMGGCGYSKSFQIGYSLGCALWPNGTDKPHGWRNGDPDRDGGYAIGVC